MVQATVAVLGNPNCGKTSLFNRLTGANQQVGNWPGVTVEKKSGLYRGAAGEIALVDLPGTYSLDVGIGHGAIDEKVARDYVLANEADLYINIIDAGNIERNLYLTTQLLEMQRPVLVVLNMMDVAKEKHIRIDVAALSQRLGCDVVPICASRNQGIDALKAAIDGYLASDRQQRTAQVSYSAIVEQALAQLEGPIAALAAQWHIAPRWLAGRLLEGDQSLEVQCSSPLMEHVLTVRMALEKQGAEDADILFANDRYTFIETLIDGVVSRNHRISRSMTQMIDSVVLNRVLGLPIFFAVMYLMFMFTINVGSAFIDFFDIAAGALFVDGWRYLLGAMGSPPWLTTLLADGVGGGIQTVATFIPVIGCLFLFLSVLEDSGYMARAAFVMDRTMRTFGLPGKAFVPVLVGFGCNVPAIMATRTLEQDRDRKLTIMMNPFMSCGARLPVYALFAVVFFPNNGQNVVFSLYLVGILMAVLTGLVMKHTLLPGQSSPFVMELPRYHVPNIQGILLHTWDRLKSFVIKAGKTIVLMVTVLGMLNSLGSDGSFGHDNSDRSVLSVIGRSLTPAFAPMGIQENNWPATVGIFTGIFAKEAVVGTVDSLYGSLSAEGREDDESEPYNLLNALSEAWASIPENFSGLAATAMDPLGLDVGTIDDANIAAQEQGVHTATYSAMYNSFGDATAAYAYLLFVLLYVPCVAVLGAVRREAGVRWLWLVAGWTTYVAYTVATGYYQLVNYALNPLFASVWLTGLILVFIGVVLLLRYLGRRERTEQDRVSLLPEGVSSAG